MNTFLPASDFQLVAKILDPQRIDRQIQEAYWLALRMKFCPDIPQWIYRSNPQLGRLWMNPKTGIPYFGSLWTYIDALNRRRFKLRGTHHQFFFKSEWMSEYPQIKLRWPPEVHQSMMGGLCSKPNIKQGKVVDYGGSYYRMKATQYAIPYDNPFQVLILEYPVED
jgi:hypothetical protein